MSINSSLGIMSKTQVQLMAELEERDLMELALVVARYCHVTVGGIADRNHRSEDVRARALMMSALCVHHGWSVSAVARLFGRDRNSVYNALASVLTSEVERFVEYRATVAPKVAPMLGEQSSEDVPIDPTPWPPLDDEE